MYILNLALKETHKGYELNVDLFSQGKKGTIPQQRFHTKLKMDPQPVNQYDKYPHAVAELLLQAAARLHTAEYICPHVDTTRCHLVTVDRYEPPAQDAIPGF